VKSRLPVLLVQLPVPGNPTTNVPLAAGYLKAYAYAQGLLEGADLTILSRELVDSAGDAQLVEAIVAQRPSLLGLSLYTWNSERTLTIAQQVKARLPDLQVIVGGPEVQTDNSWLLAHPAVDVAVIGEGEQTFADLLSLALQRWASGLKPLLPHDKLAHIPGLIFHDALGNRITTAERVALSDLSLVPSPYLLGYLDDTNPDSMLMVEVSRWCPYACSFCLYGRNMGARLGNRYFPLERLLAEIEWGRARGMRRVHFIEANLNLVPQFWPLMEALAELNSDGSLALYAELRGEHLKPEVVDALCRAGLKVAEVGLQTANPVALKAAHRRTDLQKWAAGTRRLLERGVEIYLDVILGLPEDDQAGVEQTLDFIQREQLGSYDIFTLQVLPGTAVRAQAQQYQLRFQERPPYYVLGSDRFDYATLRRLRRELKLAIGLDPDVVEGCPEPRLDALTPGGPQNRSATTHQYIDLRKAQSLPPVTQLAAHIDLLFDWDDLQQRQRANDYLREALLANPSSLIDCYLFSQSEPQPAELTAWREALPYQPGYLDRVAVYRREEPEPLHERVSPRLWLVVPWTLDIDPKSFEGCAELIWQYEMADQAEPPLRAWLAAGGAGIWIPDVSEQQVERWRSQTPLLLWHGLSAASET
jgi:Fe-S oxidoreductase